MLKYVLFSDIPLSFSFFFSSSFNNAPTRFPHARCPLSNFSLYPVELSDLLDQAFSVPDPIVLPSDLYIFVSFGITLLASFTTRGNQLALPQTEVFAASHVVCHLPRAECYFSL